MLIFIVQNIDVENSFSTSKNAKILNVAISPTFIIGITVKTVLEAALK